MYQQSFEAKVDAKVLLHQASPRARRPFWCDSHSRSAAAGSADRAAGVAVADLATAACASRSYCAAHRLGRIATTWSDSIHVMPAAARQAQLSYQANSMMLQSSSGVHRYTCKCRCVRSRKSKARQCVQDVRWMPCCRSVSPSIVR